MCGCVMSLCACVVLCVLCVCMCAYQTHILISNAHTHTHTHKHTSHATAAYMCEDMCTILALWFVGFILNILLAHKCQFVPTMSLKSGMVWE